MTKGLKPLEISNFSSICVLFQQNLFEEFQRQAKISEDKLRKEIEKIQEDKEKVTTGKFERFPFPTVFPKFYGNSSDFCEIFPDI